MFKSGKFIAGTGIGILCLLLVAATFAFTITPAQPAAQAAPVAQATPAPASTTPPTKSEIEEAKKAGVSGKQDVPPDSPYEAAFNKAFAAKLGVSEETLNSAFSAAISDTTAQMVKDGALDTNGAAKLQTLASKGPGGLIPIISPQNSGPKDIGGKFGEVTNPKALFQNAFPAIAPLFKLSVDELNTKMQDGQSLRELAAASNVDLQTLKNAIQASAKTQLDAAVKAGKIDQAAADDAFKTMTSYMDNFLDAMIDPVDAGVKFLRTSDATWQAAAQLLNLPVQTLKDQVQQGKSVLEIARSQNVDEKKLRDAIQVSMQSQLSDLVKSGKFTDSQIANVVPVLPKFVEAFINEKGVKKE